ncbi:MAG TPA: CHASE3 domain-containing protein [Blastocatellia bacterium]|nr:CHASE3 domain-containing protein [Blastocatellia bacterium]
MRWTIEKKITAGAGLVLAILLINALISYRATRKLIDNERLVTHSYEVIAQLEGIMDTMDDAETGERDYLITGEESYLKSYQSAVGAIHARVSRLGQLTTDDANQQARLPELERQIADRLDNLKSRIDWRKGGHAEVARQFVLSGAGEHRIDGLRQDVSGMESEENDLLKQRSEELKASGRDSFLTDFVANLIACALLSSVSYITISDVTARKRAEEALRQQREWLQVTLSSIGDAVIATDTNGAITFLNPVAESLTRWKQEESQGQQLREVFNIVNEQTRQTVENPALRAMREGLIVGLANHTVLIAQDGTETPIDDSGAPIKGAEGKIIGAVLIFRDITERRLVEEERSKLLTSERAAREKAEAASRSKDEFVAMISHEIRSPLNSILGWAQMLRRGKFDQAETARAVEIIERNARSQSQLIEDLLDISRVITGKLTLNVRSVELAQILESALDSIRPAAEAKDIRLQARLESRGSMVSGDPNRLQQVVWNLLSNAVKFTPRHGRVDVSLERLERVDSQLQITVSDSGVGINPEFLPFVFDRFSQANTTSERKYGGLGLGLAIVRHLVELHGGTVRADSLGEGQGATFTVTLPVKAVRGATSEIGRAAPGVENAGSLSDAITLDGLRVMIVDDEAETRDLLTAMLTQCGAEVRACASAAEALEEIKQWRPIVLVSDIGMPDEDGYALIGKLRALGPERGGDIPAVALTAFARSEDRMRALASGFQMHVPKPIEAGELIVVIASLAGRLGKDVTG